MQDISDFLMCAFKSTSRSEAGEIELRGFQGGNVETRLHGLQGITARVIHRSEACHSGTTPAGLQWELHLSRSVDGAVAQRFLQRALGHTCAQGRLAKLVNRCKLAADRDPSPLRRNCRSFFSISDVRAQVQEQISSGET